MATKKIPYGISDFRRVVEENYYYVDKTRFIEKIEQALRFLFLIRPRRFGKSLWLAKLSSYYDVAAKDDFDRLFGQYYIGQHPTGERNSYLILKFNFAMVNPEIDKLNESFEDHATNCFEDFNAKYAHLLGECYLEGYAQRSNAESRLEYIALRCEQAKLPIYLIIDEYDNFTDVVLSRYGCNRYCDMMQDIGFFRSFFNKVKGMATGVGAALKRMFITGVSPIGLDDVMHGFNKLTIITMDPRFNEILGFTEGEVRDMLEYNKSEGCWLGDTGKILSIMREWYGNYCFSRECRGETLSNSTLVLYFMDYLTRTGKIPNMLVDTNVNINYRKLRNLLVPDQRLSDNFSRIREIAEKGEISSEIVPSFPGEELLYRENFTSLLFYFGLLTIDRVERGELVLKVPNLTIRQVLFSYIERGYQEAEVFNVKVGNLKELMKNMAYRGEWRPVFEYFGEEVKAQLGIRDFLEGEKVVQTLHLVYMNLANYFIIWPERELNKGYTDLWMSPNLLNHTEMKYSYVVEFKYLKHDAGEEAREQLRKYADDAKIEATRGTTTVRRIAVVYRAWELAALEEVVD